MKNNWLKKALPHVIAVVIFVIVSLVFCKPVLEGNGLSQQDVEGWKGAAQNAFAVKEKTGKMPLWNTSIFSGMPNYQIAMEGKSALPDLQKIFALGLPDPANYFFIACLCFYILGICLGLNPILALFGGLAYGFATYNPVILQAGHNTKMMAIAFLPLLLGGIMLIFRKRYWVGLAVATLGAYMVLMANHPQIVYYFLIVTGFIAVFYIVKWIQEKDFKQVGLALVLCGIAAAVGLGAYYLTYATTREYTEYTMRGGKSVEIDGDKVTATKTKGLDEDYAMAYSMRIQEPLVMLMPRAFGGASIGNATMMIGEDSKAITNLTQQGVPAQNAMQLANLPMYWGGMINAGEVGTNGPPYVGALIFLLALIGFVIIKGPLKWGLLGATVLGIVMSWGSFFPGFNLFLLHNLPLYNKFRAPSMALVIPQLTLAVMAAVTLQKLLFADGGKELLKSNFKKIIYVFAGLTGLLVLLYIGQNYTPGIAENALTQGGFDKQNGNLYASIVAGLKADRQSLFGGQLLRTVAYILVLLGSLYLFLKGTLKPGVVALVLGIIIFVDLFAVDKKYLPDDMYAPRDAADAQAFAKNAVDDQILSDKDPHYRVLNYVEAMNGNHTAYYHRSVLGYHPAKLRIYQDVIERYLTNGQPSPEILNALDTKYIITQNEKGQMAVIPNPNAYGAAWFVKSISPQADVVGELQGIGHTNLRDTAIVPQGAVQSIGAIQPDSAASVQLVKYSNDLIEYTTNNAHAGFAVFSEVYYPAGWVATIDGKETPIIKTDYFMRGLSIPAGKHSVKFTFDPPKVQRALTISYISSILVAILVLGGFAMQWWEDKKRKTTV